MPWNDVHLNAKRRHVEIVDDVLAGKDEFNVAAHRDVQFVDFPSSVGLLGFPHPLFADHVNIQSVLRGMAKVDIDDGSPAEHHHGQKRRNDDPGEFETHVAVNRNADFVFTLAAIFEKEKDNRGGDGDG